MMHSLSSLRIAIGIAVLALVLAACGGAATDSGSTTSTSGNAGSSAPASSGSGGIYDYGSGAPATTPSGSGQSAPSQGASPGSLAPSDATPAKPDPAAVRYVVVPDKSKATYHAKQKTFVPGIGADVNGSTSDVAGTIFFDPQNPSRSQIGTITVNVETLNSGIGLRDQRLHGEFLESSKFPTVSFKTKRVEGLPSTRYTDGQELHLTIAGDLTIHGTTREVSFDATATISGGTLTSTAKTTIQLTDFGMQVPDLLNFVKAENSVGLELSLTAQRA